MTRGGAFLLVVLLVWLINLLFGGELGRPSLFALIFKRPQKDYRYPLRKESVVSDFTRTNLVGVGIGLAGLCIYVWGYSWTGDWATEVLGLVLMGWYVIFYLFPYAIATLAVVIEWLEGRLRKKL